MSRAVTSIPGVQNPHCRPCSAVNARRNAIMTGSFSNPSIVVICRAFAQHRIGDARPRWFAVDQQRARTACALLAAKVGAGQADLLAQQIGQMRARLHRLADLRTVYGEGDRRHWAVAWTAARVRAVR